MIRHRLLALLVLGCLLAFGLRGELWGREYDPLTVQPVRPIHLEFSFHDALRNRDIPLRVYLPEKSGPSPVILFSHGLGGLQTGSAFLGEHWAGRGYIAIFLQHPGSDDAVWKDPKSKNGWQSLKEAASLDNFLLRVQDVHAVLDQLETWNRARTNALAGRLDLARIGMAGHSFGAVTTEAVSGESLPLSGTRSTDPRIKAAVVLSPSAPTGFSADRAFSTVKIPWLLMTGTKDLAPIGHADMNSRLAVYPALRGGPKYQLVLFNAEHSVFTDRALPGDREPRNPNHHRIILALSTAFWDAYLSGKAEALAWLASAGPRSIMQPGDEWRFATQ